MTVHEARAQLADVMAQDVPYQTWWRWERGAVIPTREAMAAIHKLTAGEVSADDFYHLVPDRDAA